MEDIWRAGPSREDFQAIEARNLPVAFSGIVREWPAFERWNPAAGGLEHLKAISGESPVQAMVSSDGSTFYGDIRSHERVLLLFKDFIDMVSSSREHIYLAQDSKEKAPLASLGADVVVPGFLDSDVISNINLWMTSTSSRSSIHYDPYHNVLGVVAGQKKVTLWPPDSAPCLYLKPLYGEASNHSEVNFVAPDYERFPRFRDALIYSRTLVLNAGDAVFIPEGWFHQVDSASTTIAVNFWWPSKQSSGFGSVMDPYYLRRILSSLLDVEKDLVLGWSPVKTVKEESDEGLENINIEALTPTETEQLHAILSWVAVAVEKEACSTDEDPVASIFLNTKPLSLRRIFVVMVSKFPRSLEALVLHALSPAAAELLTKQFEEMDRTASETSQGEFYKRFYSVFDDPNLAMAALLDRKEAFASKALGSVIEKFVSCKIR